MNCRGCNADRLGNPILSQGWIALFNTKMEFVVLMPSPLGRVPGECRAGEV